MTDKKRGGWSNPASADNGRKSRRGGRPTQKIIERAGEQRVVLREGDEVTVVDAGNPRVATVSIVDGALILTNDTGGQLIIVLSE